ncbi:MAG: HAD hydrolase family protein [Coriobacteriales bacterium]|nr:HAD hydrolase family protein [Coriobacteriales bacterium]
MFDIDDTLIQAGTHLSPRVLAALSAAHDAGYMLGVASGRTLCSVDKRLLEGGLMDFAICSNGATVTRLSDGTRLAERLMSKQDALDCYEMASVAHPAWNGFFNGRAYFEWKGASYMLTGRTGALARASKQGGKKKSIPERIGWIAYKGARYVWRMVTNRSHRQVRSILPHLRRARGGVEKIGCTILDTALCEQVAQVLRDDGRYEVIKIGATELEICARGVTKGTSALILLEQLGMERSQAVAFGDSANDMPLVEGVGRFVAMGNADSELKAIASEVCPSVAEDGVAVWIERLLSDGVPAEG